MTIRIRDTATADNWIHVFIAYYTSTWTIEFNILFNIKLLIAIFMGSINHSFYFQCKAINWHFDDTNSGQGVMGGGVK